MALTCLWISLTKNLLDLDADVLIYIYIFYKSEYRQKIHQGDLSPKNFIKHQSEKTQKCQVDQVLFTFSLGE